jgi:hypothetical protein
VYLASRALPRRQRIAENIGEFFEAGPAGADAKSGEMMRNSPNTHARWLRFKQIKTLIKLVVVPVWRRPNNREWVTLDFTP